MPTNDDLGVRQADAMEAVAEPDIATRRESGFIISGLRDDISSGGTYNFHLKNPTSDTSIDAIEIEYHTNFEGVARIYDSFSSGPSGGTALSVQNLLMDENAAANDGDMVANADVTFTETDTHTVSYIPSSSPTRGAAVIDAATPVIEPGREIVIELTNLSDNVGTASIEVSYTEFDRVFSRN